MRIQPCSIQAIRQFADNTSLIHSKFSTCGYGCVRPDSLLCAMARFGVPAHMLQIIRAIYSNRRFQVRDAGHISHHHTQNFGICQGCPLSPFLFIMLMTVLMPDAKRMLHSSPGYFEEPQHQIQEWLIVAVCCQYTPGACRPCNNSVLHGYVSAAGRNMS